jgi:hypothetical protein
MDGLNGNFVPVRLTEVGADLSRFRSSAAFACGLTLCPNPRVTGGKVLKSKTKKGASRLAKAFRMAANALLRSQSPLADCFRRLGAKMGAPEAITAMAHKLSRIVYHLVRTGENFDPSLWLQQQEQQKQSQQKRIRKAAARLGFTLVPTEGALP